MKNSIKKAELQWRPRFPYFVNEQLNPQNKNRLLTVRKSSFSKYMLWYQLTGSSETVPQAFGFSLKHYRRYRQSRW